MIAESDAKFFSSSIFALAICVAMPKPPSPNPNCPNLPSKPPIPFLRRLSARETIAKDEAAF